MELNNLSCYDAAKNGDLKLLKYLHENGYPWNESICEIAALNDHLEILNYAHQNGCPWNEITCYNATCAGHLNILIYAHQNGCPLGDDIYYYTTSNGQLDCLKYVYNNLCEWDDQYILKIAAEKGHLNIIIYVREIELLDNDKNKLKIMSKYNCKKSNSVDYDNCISHARIEGYPLNNDILNIAIKYGHLDIFKYICNNTPSSNPDLIIALDNNHPQLVDFAIDIGYHRFDCNRITPKHFETLKLITQHHHIQFNKVAAIAAENDDLDMVKYCFEKTGLMDGYEICNIAIKKGFFNIFKYASGHIHGNYYYKLHITSAEYGHLDILKYAYEHACQNGYDRQLDNNICNIAVEKGYLDILKYAHQNGCQLDDNICNIALEKGYLDILKYAHENGYKWNNLAIYNTSKNGHLECLKYVHQNGYQLDNNAIYGATETGQLEILKYILNNKYYCDQLACAYLMIHGHIDCIKYLHENYCFFLWDVNSIESASRYGHLEVIKYAHKNYINFKNIESKILTIAIETGHINIIEYLSEYNIIPCGIVNHSTIARQGLDYFKYIHSKYHYLNFNESTCVHIADQGNLDILKYAHQNGAKLDSCDQICRIATEKGYLDILKYAHQNGCSIYESLLELSIKNKHFDCFKYIYENISDYRQKRNYRDIYNSL